jgi:hypothetical protein
MGRPDDKNGCLFPFGNNILTLFVLMVMDDEDRGMSEENFNEDEKDGGNDF